MRPPQQLLTRIRDAVDRAVDNLKNHIVQERELGNIGDRAYPPERDLTSKLGGFIEIELAEVPAINGWSVCFHASVLADSGAKLTPETIVGADIFFEVTITGDEGGLVKKYGLIQAKNDGGGTRPWVMCEQGELSIKMGVTAAEDAASACRRMLNYTDNAYLIVYDSSELGVGNAHDVTGLAIPPKQAGTRRRDEFEVPARNLSTIITAFAECTEGDRDGRQREYVRGILRRDTQIWEIEVRKAEAAAGGQIAVALDHADDGVHFFASPGFDLLDETSGNQETREEPQAPRRYFTRGESH